MENGLLGAVTSGLSTVIDWVGSVVNALVGADGALNALLPIMAIGKQLADLKSGKIGEGCDANTEVISYISQG